MSWKCALLYASEREPGYLGTLPDHAPEKALDLKIALGLEELRPEGMECFESAIWPEPGKLFIGAYDRTYLISDWDIAETCMATSLPTVFKNIRTLLPNAWGLCLMLHGTDNYWGYAFYENGELTRLRAGSHSTGLTHEFGQPLPEELPLLAKSKLVGDKRMYSWDNDPELLTDDQVGEEFVFQLGKRVFGEVICEGEHWFDLRVEQFKKPRTLAKAISALGDSAAGKKSGFWARLFGRG